MQNKKLIPDGFKKAVISNVNILNRTVDVYFVQNPNTTITGIKVSGLVTLTVALIGKTCKIDIFDEVNSKDMVMAYYY